jgi:hypothetical protein
MLTKLLVEPESSVGWLGHADETELRRIAESNDRRGDLLFHTPFRDLFHQCNFEAGFVPIDAINALF